MTVMSGEASSSKMGTSIEPPKTPKENYRLLKKRFKFLVYENECYQEELRNLQRKLLKLSRDKNFLLDRLLSFEKPNDSSDESDSSIQTRQEEKKPKRMENGQSASELFESKKKEKKKKKEMEKKEKKKEKAKSIFKQLFMTPPIFKKPRPSQARKRPADQSGNNSGGGSTSMQGNNSNQQQQQPTIKREHSEPQQPQSQQQPPPPRQIQSQPPLPPSSNNIKMECPENRNPLVSHP